MEQRQLQQAVEADQIGGVGYQAGERQPQNQREYGGDAVENQMRQRQPLAVALAAEHADKGGRSAAADVGADGHRKALGDADLAARQCRQR